VGAVKVLFLDIDGVLNSADWYGRRPRELRDLPNTDHNTGLYELDPEAVARLGRILDATGALVVLSSSWRISWEVAAMRAVLGARGFDGARLIDATPVLRTKHNGETRAQRGDEIALWLRTGPEPVEAFAVLDDSDDMDDEEGIVRPRFVRTSWATGLLDEHVERVIALLGRVPAKESA
jgi:hypothetical protein